MPNARITGAVIAGMVLVVLAGGWYLFLRNDSPPPVDLDTAVASVSSPTATVEPTQTPTSTATAAATQTPANTYGETWVVSSAGDTFAGYRIEEQLVSIGTNIAVGRTTDVTGSLEFDGENITAVEIEVDLTTLKSDDSRRDNQLGRRGLQTRTFPTATFILTTPIPIGEVPQEGVLVSATAIGKLTFHGVTQEVAIDLEGQLINGLVVIVGSTPISLPDYDIEPPVGRSVLSVSEDGTLEFQVIFKPAD